MNIPHFSNMTLEEGIEACVKAYDTLEKADSSQRRDYDMLILWLERLKRFQDGSMALRQALSKLPDF